MTVKVFVPCDAAALSMGAEAVANAVHAEIVSRKLDFRLIRNGSRGLLWLEPLGEGQTPKGPGGYGPGKTTARKSNFHPRLGEAHKHNVGFVGGVPDLQKQERHRVPPLG